ncbi:MAG: hypothetical protein RRY79_00735 [Clostridia bacterium]
MNQKTFSIRNLKHLKIIAFFSLADVYFTVFSAIINIAPMSAIFIMLGFIVDIAMSVALIAL